MEPYDSGHVESRSEGRPWSIAGFVLAALAFFTLPVIVGPIGAVLGWVGYRKGDRLGLWAMWASIAMALLGLVIAAILITNDGGY